MSKTGTHDAFEIWKPELGISSPVWSVPTDLLPLAMFANCIVTLRDLSVLNPKLQTKACLSALSPQSTSAPQRGGLLRWSTDFLGIHGTCQAACCTPKTQRCYPNALKHHNLGLVGLSHERHLLCNAGNDIQRKVGGFRKRSSRRLTTECRAPLNPPIFETNAFATTTAPRTTTHLASAATINESVGLGNGFNRTEQRPHRSMCSSGSR